MGVNLYRLVRPLAFALDAETAHHLTIKALRFFPPHRPPPLPESLKSRVAGIDFPSPVGLAAGFDKDAQVPEQMLTLGFGFVEVGTLTPLPQAGPRVEGPAGIFHAAAAGGETKAAPVPAEEGPRSNQPHGLQQLRPAGRLRPAAA